MKRLAWFVVSALALLAPVQAASAQNGDPLRVDAWPMAPVLWQDPSGEWQGYEAEALRAAAKALGRPIEWRRVKAFRNIFDGVRSGTADIAAAGITLTAAREEIVDFSVSTVATDLAMLVRDPGDEEALNNPFVLIRSRDDLRGKRVATLNGSTSVPALTDLGAYPVLVEHIEEGYKLLAEDKVDAVVFDRYPLMLFSRSEDGSWSEVVGPGFSPQRYAFAVRSGSTLREELNRALLALEENGALESLRDTYLPR